MFFQMSQKNISRKFSKIRESIFLKSFKLLKSSPDKAFLIILFDSLFLASFLYVMPTIAKYFAQSLVLPQTYLALYIIMLFQLMYYLIVLFIYSFFKYSVLDFIKSLFERTETSFKRLGQFYALNIVIAGMFFAIFLIFGFIIESVKEPYRPFILIFLATPYMLFLYVIMNTSHSLFYQGASHKESFMKGLKITFTKMRTYREIILVFVLFALLLGLLLLGIGYLVKLTSSNYTLYLTLYDYFKRSSKFIFDIVLYFTIFVNRISFYSIIKENK